MRQGRIVWILLCLLCAVGVWFLWQRENGRSGLPNRPQAAVAPAVVTTVHSLSTAPQFLATASTNTARAMAAANTNRLVVRLSNTTKTIGQLVHDDHAILLENALIDTTVPLNFVFPKNLQPQGDPGAYIVQARGPIDQPFRALLAQAGATIVSYIPNDAYLVRASTSVAGILGANALVQAVIPYEPYYKIQPSLLGAILQNKVLPTTFNVAAFPNNADETRSALENAGWTIVSQQPSPFGKVFTIQGKGDVTALARMSQPQIIEPVYPRITANDLSRVTVGVATDPQVPTNYLGLTGAGVTVEVNDTGIDKNHPDLTGRVIGNLFDTNLTGRVGWDLVDTNGHGTHVAGIIAGDGSKSDTVTNVPNSIMPGVDGQFRGMAPEATLFSVAALDNNGFGVVADQALQEIPALTNALISNNSWDYGDNNYDLAAASYDAATRDALPTVTGSQPVLFVFAAGNSGGGDNDGFGGVADTILSPATAKDVITVGALEQLRFITNVVTDLFSNQSAVWQPETDSSNQVAFYSSRGNVGINFEGTFGRYKPDVVAPGSFVVSTRSEQWDEAAYYNPTNDQVSGFSDELGPTNINYYTALFIPPNTTQMSIEVDPNALSSSPFVAPTLSLWKGTDPRTSTPDLVQSNPIIIPPDSALSPLNTTWTYAVSNNTSQTLFYDVFVDVITTNDLGNYLTVLSNLNDSLDGDVPPHYYRYESGTSMSAANVSGVLALMQEYLTNTFGITPSPALMKAMLINGARPEPGYDFNVDNAENYQGWGLINLPAILPPGITTNLNNAGGESMLVLDQSPANALATGDQHTYIVTVNTNAFGQYLPLRVTLAWTDPPGDPVASIKLVNSLELVVTNLDDPTNAVYYGNDIASGNTYNTPEASTNAPPFDVINNVQNVFIAPLLGSKYSITVIGREVNVNAVTAQTNNIVQDYALAVSCGEGEVPNALTSVADNGIGSQPTTDQQITTVITTNQPLFNQFVGASSPLLGTNTIAFTTNTAYGNAQVTAGQTNQWHFYVVSNTGTNNSFTNAAFVTFNPDTLSLPRMGVFAGSQDNATTPEADIDLYVSTDPGLTNLDPTVIANCINANGPNGPQVGESAPAGVNGVFYGASLGRGGTEFVVDTNSTPQQVYYIGVKSERQVASEYGFISFFSNIPFSQMQNGNQIVNVQPSPVNIPEGTPAFSQPAFSFGLALYPIPTARVVVTNVIPAQNFGDLIGTLAHPGQSGLASTPVVLNNHDSLGNTIADPGFVYDDSGLINASTIQPAGYQWRPSTGPGTLNGFVGQDGFGVWILTEADTAPGQLSRITGSTLFIQRLQKLGSGVETNVSVSAGGWAYGYIDVSPGATNLTIYATNLTATANPPVELFVKFGSEPTTNDFDIETNLTPNGVISIGPPLESGRYYIGLYDPDLNSTTQEIVLFATLGLGTAPVAIFNSTDTPKPILDDAVTDDSIYVPANQIISSLDVALAVQHPRISDLVFHLISPDGTRVLLMENRGATDPNGAGGIGTVTTNVPVTGNFDAVPAGDYSGGTVADWNVTGNQVSVQTDPANAYGGSNNLLALANGTLSTTLNTTPGATYTLTFQYRGPGIVGWWRGESNGFSIATESIYGNDGTMQGVTFTNGEVAQAFHCDPSVISFPPGMRIRVPDLPIFALTNSLSLECWTRPAASPGFTIFYRGDSRGGYDPYSLGINSNGIYGFAFQITDPNNISVSVQAQGFVPNQWYHVAGTLDGNSGAMKLYTNGFMAVQTTTARRPLGPLIAGDDPGIGIGNTHENANNFPYNGDIDEMSLYSRSLSASEVQAMYNDSTNGKFDPVEFPLSAPQSLAEAQININGNPTTIFGNNTTWQTYSVSFTGAQGSSTTPIQIRGIEPGMLLDAASVTSVTTNYSFLVFTEDTNKTTTPIKFAIPPFVAGTANSAGYVQWSTSVGGNGHWYKAVVNSTTNPLDWTEADQIAHNEGGYLATITSAAENNFVFSLIDSPQFFEGIANNGSGPAIGGTNPVDGSILSDWVWETGEPWTYANWAPGQPDFPAETRAQYWSGTQGVPAATWNNLQPLDINLGGYVIEKDTMPNDVYYLPEQSLDTYDGLNAQGLWTLEVQDDRVGATTPIPELLSWQLRFTFATGGIGIPPGVTATNVIPANSWAYYKISVPANADIATNTLVFATGPLNVWFDSNNNPAGINPPDWLLFGPATTGSSTLSTFSVPTNIVPGGVYYIGLYNPNNYQVTNGFEYDFHYFQITPLNPGVPVTNTVAGKISGDGVDYYSVTVPTNADYATNILLSSTVPVNVWFNQTKAPVCLTPPDSLLISNATNGVSILSSNSVPPLQPGLKYYLAVQNTNAANATYSLDVKFHTISILTNGVPETNSIPTNGFVYYEVRVPTNADYATNLLLFASLPVDVWFNQNGLPTGINPPDSLLIPNATSGAFTLSAGSTPPLVPGATYYLGVYNPNAVPVNVQLEVNLHLIPPQVITGPTITSTNIGGTNGFLLRWSGPTNYQYLIQWTTNLTVPVPWNTVLNPIINVTYTPTNGHYSWFDDGTLAGGFPPQKFYRVVANLLSGPITTNSPAVTNITVPGSITPLTVTVPASATSATNVLVSASGPINVWFSQTTPFMGGTNAGDVLMLSSLTSGNFLLTGGSTPPLVPGANYYLGLQNTGTTNVSSVFQVNFGFAPGSGIASGPTLTYTNIGGTNAGVLITWYAQTNYHYQIQWTTALAPAPASWTTIPGVVLTNLSTFTPTNGVGEFQYFDNGSLTGGFGKLKFYRLIAYPPGTTIPPSLVITSVKAAPGNVQIQWAGSTNYVYDVVWTTNLALPTASWNVLSNLTSPTLTYSSGVFTFTDTNLLTPEFFRVLLLP